MYHYPLCVASRVTENIYSVIFSPLFNLCLMLLTWPLLATWPVGWYCRYLPAISNTDFRNLALLAKFGTPGIMGRFWTPKFLKSHDHNKETFFNVQNGRFLQLKMKHILNRTQETKKLKMKKCPVTHVFSSLFFNVLLRTLNI